MEEWFKLKRYPHIGLPIKRLDYQWVKEFVTNPDLVKKYSFLPFIHKSIVKRKYRPDNSSRLKNPSGKRKRTIGKPKVRSIFYASHLDSLIFSYYNWILCNMYENYIQNKPFKDSVVAYRKIPLKVGVEKNKCNIDFAKSTFEFIKNNSDKTLSVVVADITSFFDNLNHNILKKQWCAILGLNSLPDDHYNVFKSLTRIRYVESEQLFIKLDKNVIVERGKPNFSQAKEYKTIKVDKQKYFKEKNVVAFCAKNDFIKNHLDLLVNQNNKVGIPQGSPLSATLANVYMLEFDSLIGSEIDAKKGLYLRYSDDLIIVCEQKYEDYFIDLIRRQIRDLVLLEIKNEKTKVYRFEKIGGDFKGFQIDELSKKYLLNKPLEFLGFTFDGQRVLIKSSGFSKFYRAMKRSFRKSTSLAKFSKNPDKKIFRGKLYKRFTYKGARRKLIYQPSITDKSKYVKTTKFYWGNYISYLLKANHVMREVSNSDAIRRQSRRFWGQFGKLMKRQQNNLKEYLERKQLLALSKENHKKEE